MTTQSAKQTRILILAEDTSVASRVADLLLERGCEAAAHRDPADLMAAVSAQAPDLVILCVPAGLEPNYSLGVALCGVFAVPYIVLAAVWDEIGASAAAKNGALAFLASRYPQLHHCVPAIMAALERHAALRGFERRVVRLEEALQHSRTISAACGVLMERLHVNRREAFERLRSAARARRMRVLDSAAGMLAALEAINELGDAYPVSGAEPHCDRLRSFVPKNR